MKTKRSLNTKKSYEKLIIILLYITVFQDFALGILYSFTGQASLVKILFFTKDILMVILFLWALLRKKYSSIIYVFLALYFGILVFQSFVSISNGITLFSVLSSIRGWMLMPCLIIIGYGIKNKKFFFKHLKRFIGPFMIFVSIFGLIDFFVDSFVTSTLPFWKNVVGIGNFMEDIKGQETLYGLPGNFYGQYSGEFFSQKRLVSFWGGPLTSGYVLAIPTLYYFYRAFIIEKKLHFKLLLSFLIVFGALVCTFTRAIILTVVVLMFIILIVKKRKNALLATILVIGFVLAVLLNINKLESYIMDGSFIEHMRQFSESFSQISLFGTGVATFGVRTEIGTESAYISSFGQNGIIFFLLYIIGNIYPLYCLYKLSKKYKQSIIIKTIIVVGIIMIISGIISEQLIAYTTIAPYYIVLGFLASNKKELKPKRSVQSVPVRSVCHGE